MKQTSQMTAAALVAAALFGCSGGPDAEETTPPLGSSPSEPAEDPPIENSGMSEAFYWGVTQELPNHTARFRAILAAPADCTARSVFNSVDGVAGYSALLVYRSDDELTGYSVGRNGGDIGRVQYSAGGVEYTAIEQPGLPSTETESVSFSADSNFELHLVAENLEPNSEGFAPDYAFALAITCAEPFEVAVDQGDDAVLVGFEDLEGDGFFSPAVATSSTTGFATVGGNVAGYISGNGGTAEAGSLVISHPGGTDTYDVALNQFVSVESSPGTYDFSLDHAAADLFDSRRWISIYSFSEDLLLQPGQLSSDPTD